MNVLARLLLVMTLAAALIGCGGGGGGGTVGGNNILTYLTDWSGSTALSHYVALLDANNTVKASANLNKSDGVAVSLAEVATGTYRLQVIEFSQPDATGVALGEIDTAVTINGPQSFKTSSAAPARIVVTPPSASLTQEQSTLFYASGVSATGDNVFLDSTLITWSVLGGIGDIDARGNFIARNLGSGAVRASYNSLGLTASAPVDVSAFNAKKGKWTVLVFLNAANDLYRFSDPNFNQMEHVANNPDVRFVVQWKQTDANGFNPTFVGTRRYLVKPDTTSSIASELVQDMGDVDMGDPTTLSNFIAWGKTRYPADHYALVVWNHGSGWNRSPNLGPTRAVSYDDEKNTVIQTWELNQALGNNHFDILAWDASLMQMFEVAYEVRAKVDYVVGSEESPPGEGYPYDGVFQKFQDSPDLAPVELAKGFVDATLAVPDYATRKITQSVLDTSKMGQLATDLDTLSQLCVANAAAVQTAAQNARANAQSYSPSVFRYYRDLRDLLKRMKADASGVPAAVSAAIDQVLTSAANVIVYEGHNSKSPDSTGLAIDFTPSGRFASYQPDYAQLKLAQDTHWDEWLSALP